MFIYTARLKKRRIIPALIIIVMIVLMLVFIVLHNNSGTAVATLSGNLVVKSNDDRIAFLRSYGWEVNETPLSEQSVLIPKTFSAVYEKYNELQLSQGCDLSDYSGLDVMRYSYEVTNYPDYTGAVIAEILVYKNCVIGGDIHAAAMDGFMHGIEKTQ